MSNIVPVSFVDELIWPSWEEYASCEEEAEYPIPGGEPRRHDFRASETEPR